VAVEDLLDQIDAALAASLYYVALMGALALPDIAGALGSGKGKATDNSYIRWFDTNLPSYAGHFPGKQVYRLRSSLLHQGSAHPHGPGGTRVLIMERQVVHLVTMKFDNQTAFVLHAPTLVGDITVAARAWLPSVQGTEPYETNAAKFHHALSAGPRPVRRRRAAVRLKPITGISSTRDDDE
jgi:hypothetical protein